MRDERLAEIQRLKIEAYRAYGEEPFKCFWCGEDDFSVLTLDHVENDGNIHRKNLGKGGKTGNIIYIWLKNNGYPAGFQILCRNCNWSKHVNGGFLPNNRRNKYA